MPVTHKDNLYLNPQRNLGLGKLLRRQEEVLRGTEHRPTDSDDPKAACTTDETTEDSEGEENAA